MKNLIVKPTIKIEEAMEILNKSTEKCLLVVDENKRLLGTLTDGDLRRGLLNGKIFSNDISNSYNKKPIKINNSKIDEEDGRRMLNEHQINLIPVINEKHQIVDYISLKKLSHNKNVENSLINIPSVIIMAGGQGVRMEPFTKILPKPLIPIRDKPIIDHIIEKFTEFGCDDFHITINYKSKILKAYFSELDPEYKVNFIKEEKPLGTAGSLFYLRNSFKYPFFVTNCDIIIKNQYSKIYNFHLKKKHDITLVAAAKEYVMPYGNCEVNKDGQLEKIIEKPKYDFLINTGLYILNPEILEMIPENQFYHITELIKDAKLNGKKIGLYPVDDDSWIDIGQWTEYRKAVKNL